MSNIIRWPLGNQARHSWGTVEAQLGRKIENSLAQLGHKVTWGTVEAKPVGAHLGRS